MAITRPSSVNECILMSMTHPLLLFTILVCSFIHSFFCVMGHLGMHGGLSNSFKL